MSTVLYNASESETDEVKRMKLIVTYGYFVNLCEIHGIALSSAIVRWTVTQFNGKV